MLLVIVKANLYGDNSFTTNGNFLVSNYGVKYNLLLTVNNIEILFKFKRGTEAHFRIAGRRSTFWREISDSPTPISAEYEYDARRCLPILRQNEFPTFTIREQTYTFPCVSICTANIAILFEIYNSASRRELRPQNKREARRRNEIRPRHDLPAANPRTGRQRFYASALSDRIQSGRCRKQKFSVHLSDKKMLSMSIPLAERLRPRTLDEYIGQAHLVGQNGVFRKFLETGNVPSFILWGPPGVGKTTLAKIVATTLKRPFYTLSAVTSGVKEVREVLESARKQKFFDSKPPILFIDEIHRFNKSQQDSLLGAVEQGVVTLIGATTENPSFEVISPLLSRCQVYILQPMTDGELQTLLDRALATDPELKTREIEVQETEALFRFSGGDARKLLNILDIITGAADGKVTITNQYVTDCLQQNIALYDKNGEQHYDVISAFIKSVRGSDPNAAIYYLARMLAGGEEPRFIARRLVILASEDIGLANPNALLLANACFDTVHKIGMPEARITLAETTIYLATSPKSNSAYMAINQALSFVEHDTINRPVPLHLRNAPTKLMDQAGYGKGYKYAHDYGGFAGLEFMPETLKGKKFYEPNTRNAAEAKIAACIRELWKDKYK